VKTFIQGTLLSILVFCTASFATVLFHLRPAAAGQADLLLIGFPFPYLTQVRSAGSGGISWAADYLVYDSLLAWVIMVGACFLLQYRKAEW